MRYWGLTPQEYYDAADLWPLDPEGNILLMGIIEEAEGVQKIRDTVLLLAHELLYHILDRNYSPLFG